MVFTTSTRRTFQWASALVLPLLALALTLVLAVPALTSPPASGRGIAVTAVTADGQTLNLYQKSFALLVGVSRYAPGGWPVLEQVPAELATVKAVLEKQGFAVTTRIDPDDKALKAAFDTFIHDYGYDADNRLFFYYAGHGFTSPDGDNGYLVPVNAPDPRKDQKGFKQAALDMNDILAGCRKMDARHALFLFDSCFSGAIFKQRDLPAMPPAVSQMTAKPVRQFITAGGAGETVPAKSTFTPALVDALEHGLGDLNGDGYISGTELGLYLADKVPRHASQNPQYGKISDYDLSQGDFIFLAGGSTLVSTPASAGSTVGVLKVTADPAGARLFVDNADRGPAPLSLENLKPGEYRLRAEKSGFLSQTRTVTVEAGRTAAVRFYLEPEHRAGRLFVYATPSAAAVRILNISQSYSPGMELDAGRYQIQVAKDGYETATRWETLADGEDLNVNITLNKVAAAPAASGSAAANDLGMDFVYIQPGTFLMGSPGSEPGRESDETQHRVTLTRGFYMQTTEVTVGQWRAFVLDTGYRTEAETDGGAYVLNGSVWEMKAGYYWDNPGFSQTDSHPVTCVSWNDVQKYIGWLNRKENKSYRLPTEAEWEYACRAGSSMRFCFGDSDSTLERYAWYGRKDGDRTHPAAQKQPNAWGLYDMHGNVWEWCSDWYGDYSSGSSTDPTGPSSGTNRVFRGGSWNSNARYCRSAIRSRGAPEARGSRLGFRLALPVVR